MSISKFKLLALGTALVLVLALAFWQVSKMITFAEPVSLEEATSKVQDLYNSEVLEAKDLKEGYQLKIALENGIYNITIDKKTGNIQNMTKVEDAKNEVAKAPEQHTDSARQDENSEQKVPQESQEPQKQPETQHIPEQSETSDSPSEQTKITEQQAAAIALQHVSGEVDDVELENWGGVEYYLVEIEREEDVDAVVQIQAITGEVKTITWED